MVVKDLPKAPDSSIDQKLFQLVCDAIESAANFEIERPIEIQDSLIDDLSFDSLSISVLALELEDRLGQSILLNRWVEKVNNPSELTVFSLCEYLEVSYDTD